MKLAAVILLILTVGCGSSPRIPVAAAPVPTPTPTPPSTPPPETTPSPLTTLLLADSTSDGGQGGGVLSPVHIPWAGRLVGEADWQSSGSDIDLYVAAGGCRSSPVGKTPPQCALLASANGSAKPERFVIDVEPGEYTWMMTVASARIEEHVHFVLKLEPR
jgi:hypothetical protein